MVVQSTNQLIAHGLALRIKEIISDSGHVGRFGILVTALTRFDAYNITQAIGTLRHSGYPVRLAIASTSSDSSDLKTFALDTGFDSKSFATDLLAAGRWRNDPNIQDIPIAIASGEQPTLHTLAAFTTITSAEIAVTLLHWAAKEGNVAVNAQHTQLFLALTQKDFAELHNPYNVAEYIESLLSCSNEQRLETIREALPILGLLRDPQIFNRSGGVKTHLERNIDLCHRIRYFPKTQQRQIQNRIEKFPDEQQQKLVETLHLIDAYQRTFALEYFRGLTLQGVSDLFNLRPQKSQSDQTELPPGSTPDSSTEETDDEDLSLGTTFAEALIEGDQDTIDQISETIESAIAERDPNADEQVTVPINTGTVFLEAPLHYDNSLLEFVHAFCSDEHWGGILHSEQGSLRAAIKFYRHDGQFLNPYEPISPDDKALSIADLIPKWDDRLGLNSELVNAFRRFENERRLLIPLIDNIVMQPLVTIGGPRKQQFRSYIQASNDLLRLIRDYYEDLRNASKIALPISVARLLALDTVLVKTNKGQSNTANKATLMPLHPLHLWKYVRLIEIYEQSTDLSHQDKASILLEAENDRHFLHTLYISEILTEDQAIALPFAGSIESLPCYENTTNHYSGNDGLSSLFYTLDRFIAFYPLFVRPLRVTVVDVPSLPDLLSETSKFLAKHAVDRLPALEMRLYFTEVSASRNYLSTLMSGENERVYQELIAVGRLNLQIEPEPIDFEKIISEHQEKAVHVMAMFDQSDLAVRDFRRQQFFAGDSPFCITREFQYDEDMDEFQIIPVNNEPLFNCYNDLVNRLRSNLSNYSMGVIGRTQMFREQLDIILEKYCAQWLFIADRVLPTENRLSSTRIYAKHAGRREVLVLASTSDHFARELEYRLKQYNLYPQREQMQELLRDFSHMVGDGLLSIIQAKDGTLEEKKSIGLIGLLVATRAYKRQYPNSLVVSIDNEDARRWLRASEAKKRADLIGIRPNENDDGFIIEIIEVKAVENEQTAFTKRNGYIEGKAVEQIRTIALALAQTFLSPEFPLTPPRRETLRDLCYVECQNNVNGREFRIEWVKHLENIFKPNTPVYIRASIYHIDLDGNHTTKSELLRIDIGSEEYIEVALVTLGESEVQRLITGVAPTDWDYGPEISEIYESESQYEEHSEPNISETSSETSSISSTDERMLRGEEAKTNDEPSGEWLRQILSSFVRACEYYGIQVMKPDPSEAIIGLSVVRFPFRLARGTRKEKLDRSLEDIGREMGISNLIIQSIPNSQNLALDVPRPDRLIPHFNPDGREALPKINSIEELPIAIGVSPDGFIRVTDLKDIVHMLIGGTTGAGKTIFLYSVILSLLSRHPLADNLELVLCTSKLEDFAFFSGLPHLFGRQILTEADDAISVIGEIANHELERRSQILADQRVRSVVEHNQLVEPENRLRPIVIIVDEFADLADQVAQNRSAKADLYTNIRRIAQAGRSRSVHLVLCTQRPTADLFPSNIKTLMNARVAFRMNSQVDSRTVLDEGGAENLLGKGDMLFKTEGMLERLQGFFVAISDLSG